MKDETKAKLTTLGFVAAPFVVGAAAGLAMGSFEKGAVAAVATGLTEIAGLGVCVDSAKRKHRLVSRLGHKDQNKKGGR